MSDIPNGWYPTRQFCTERTDQVGMIHPGLNDIRSVAAEPAREAEKAYRIRTTQTHAERLHRDPNTPNLSTYGSDIGQREHLGFEDVPINVRKQLEKHHFCAANGKASNEMQ